MNGKRKLMIVSTLLVIALVGLGLYISFHKTAAITSAGMVMNSVRSANDPEGTLVVEVRPNSSVMQASAAGANDVASTENAPAEDPGSWPSVNRTLTSQRYSPLNQINAKNAHDLKVECTYDTHLHESFETEPIVIHDALIFTSVMDIFSINPENCQENWHTHEDIPSPSPLTVNRGAAYMEGRLFRGALDGQVRGYDFKTGKLLWKTSIANPAKGDMLDAAAIAWNGLVFIGTANGDSKGVKGRVYALAADTGRVVWETYLVPRQPNDPIRGPQGAIPQTAIDTWANRDSTDVPISGGGNWTSVTLDAATGRLYVPVSNPSPDFVQHLREGTNLFTNSILVLDARTGNYIKHYQAIRRDWHDHGVSNTPALITTRAGTQLLSFTPKDGRLYGYDLASDRFLYASPVTRVENIDAPFSTDKATHFCPGVGGGAEWNGVSYDPQTNLVYSGEQDWCTEVRLDSDAHIKAVGAGQPWTGHKNVLPMDIFGVRDPKTTWAGWLYATDADSGQWMWRAKSNYPILSGVTATGGGVVLFGDMGGNLYALDASNGERLWTQRLAGPIGGGVITYTANGAQKVAVAAGLTSIFSPTQPATAKIVIFGLN
jgi:alcohol dehydrogenase (cytochrome c)